MSHDPYTDPSIHHPPNPCYDKLPVIGSVNTILQARNDRRAMQLSPYPSRAFIKYEIHELIITPETDAAPNCTVNNVIYFCFFEIETSGVLWVGDTVEVEGEVIGQVAGYDFTHLPNHMNIVIKSDHFLKTGREAGIKFGSKIKFVFNQAS